MQRKKQRGLTPSSILAIAIATIVSGSAVAEDMCFKDDVGRIVKRRRPGYVEVPCPKEGEAEVAPQGPPTQWEGTGREPRRQIPMRESPTYTSPIPRPNMVDYVEAVPVPDRWRIVEALGYEENWYDPYNRNTIKADRPVYGDDWFFSLSVISDTFYEVRETPTPVGPVSSGRPGSNGIFGSGDQSQIIQNLTTEFVYYKGDTTFRPPDYEFRFTPVFAYNYIEFDERSNVNINPQDGTSRTRYFVGIQAAFVDKHLRNVSERFDFDSFRLGIQPFSSDFRGFLFQDNQLGARLFGTRDNNIYQYNIAWFRRLEQDTNSGLNDLGQSIRDDDVFLANLYRQDFPVKGFTSQVTALYNRNREGDEVHFNKNEIIERPASLGREVGRDYDVYYLGYNGDGHFGRMNLTTSLYYAFGDQTQGVFVPGKTDISAFFAAAEFSIDYDWIRPRASLLYASGDDNPKDDKSTGFDAILENPQFAAADTGYGVRQSIPLIGGGIVALSTRNGLLNNLRSSKGEGQSNFDNPGTILAGVGVDLDIMPQVRLALNANTLYVAESEVLELARNQGSIDKHMGYDLSAAVTWRPLMSQNIVIRGAYATLIPGKGGRQLFPDEDLGYFMLNAVFAY